MIEALAVADSGPLIALARINQLALLPQLCSRVLIPPAVQANGIYIHQSLIDAVLREVGE